jgi:hypothetical protein
MFSRPAKAVLLLLLTALPLLALDRRECVIAGGPSDSLEVRHLVLTGTNEEIGLALATIARERYGTRPEPSREPLRTRAARRYIEHNAPYIYERMRGVAAAYGKRVDDDAWDFSGLGFTELRAGCSIVHLPPASTGGSSVVSRDYDFSTGSLSFGSLAPGMLHPTSRPYLIELHPDRGYASIAMVAYDLLSGVLDGMNSEGLVVTMAMDDEIFESKQMEPTFGPSVGLGVLQTLRLVLDTAANVDEAKEILLQTKQYYEFVPCHFLIADRSGRSFVWEYSSLHNKEYVIENPGKPLVMTNFTLNKHMEGDAPPTVEQAKGVCRRYIYLTERLATGGTISEELLMRTHRGVDAQAPVKATDTRPPIRTFWHALYYPEERRVKFSYYLGDTATGIRRSDYLEFKLAATAATPIAATKSSSNAAAAVPNDPRMLQLGDTHTTDAELLERLRGRTQLEQLGLRNTAITDAGMAYIAGLTKLEGLNLSGTKITDAGMAHLAKLTAITGLNLSNTAITDAALVYLGSMGRLTKLNLAGTKVTDAGVTAAKKHLPFWVKITR